MPGRGRLEKPDGAAQFTRYTTYATLEIPQSGDAARARVLMEKAEHGCLVAASFRGTRALGGEVVQTT